MEVMFLLFMFLVLIIVLLVVLSDHSGHKWVYRNPYSRTCSHCNRREDNHCSSDAYSRHGMGASGWWEEMSAGAGKKCHPHKEGVTQ